ncbi:MAG TPA: hypothetical protein VGE27_10075, partial [Gemmatimonas sp.]|uniref:hypothetical protein n=1 Tax=Gemmatimonas sp. TaxID=1962908 RepID=UPI002ED84609
MKWPKTWPYVRRVTWLCMWVWLLLMTMNRRAAAQSDPRGPVRTIVTPHLRVHYQTALDSLARQAAVIAERAYAQLAKELAPPSGTIDLLLTDNVDESNGLAQVFPSNRVTIYAVPPVGMRELRFHDEWLTLVITHELAHIFHIDRARGLWRVGRWVFGRNPMLFPNAFLPSWVKEGLAVHYESALTGSGRLEATEFPGYVRAAVLDSAWLPPHRWSLATTRFPRGQGAYAYGSVLLRHGAEQPTGSMRAFVDATSSYPIPYLLSRASRIGFGKSFDEMYRDIGDSVARSAPSRAGDSAWTRISTDGWYVAAPRWLTADSLVWSANNGREVTGMYTAPARSGAEPDRVAWRNSLDVNVVNVAQGGDVIFAQRDRRDPYITRSDLYRRDRVTGDETRITHGARLTMPDVRRDGAVVAVQLGADISQVVRVSRDGRVTALTTPHDGERWAEPRWSPDGAFIAAVQLLATGEQRVVVLDSTGALRVAVTGARGVFESPSFTPDGRRLVWSSDRSGRMQIETAPLRTDVIDTLQWREERAHITQASQVSTGVYEPSVSPDGRQVAALLFGSNGNYVVTAPLDTAGPMARGQWYARTNPVARPAVRDSAQLVSAPSSPYRAWRQLLPRYWLPQVGEGRDGRMTLGASTSSVDILGRHAWSASALMQPEYRETDGHLSYRFAGLGVPLFEASVSQEWDGSYRNVSSTGATLGFVSRRRRFASVASTWTVPRVRRTMNTTLGVRYEMRQFFADVDSALGPANSALRVGTRYPSIFVNGSFATARQAGRAVSLEEGFAVAHNTTYRWREDAPGATGSWRTVLNARGYIPLPLPGYSRHALALRTTAGIADTKSGSDFSVGGVSGVSAELMPGVMFGDPSRSFPVRGVAPGVQRGIRALGGTVEYRAPLVMFSRLPSPFTLYTDRA